MRPPWRAVMRSARRRSSSTASIRPVETNTRYDRGGRDGRADRLADAAEDLARQRAQLRAGKEQRDHQLVERGREGEQRAGHQTRARSAAGSRAAAPSRRGAPRLAAARARLRSKPCSVADTVTMTNGVAIMRVAEDHAGERAGDAERGEEIEDRDRRDHDRHHDRRDQQAEQQRLEPRAATASGRAPPRCRAWWRAASWRGR